MKGYRFICATVLALRADGSVRDYVTVRPRDGRSVRRAKKFLRAVYPDPAMRVIRTNAFEQIRPRP